MKHAQPAGDNHLSSRDLRLWSLAQHVLFHWHTLVVFTTESFVVPESMGGPRRGYIDFFVPVDSRHCLAIVEFLEEELEDLRTEDWDYKGTLMPGTEVRIKVMPFSGLRSYATRAEIEKIANEFMASFLGREKREKQEDEAK